ncbi:MAG TPA: PrgI family protein [Candidatus Magasanikbacteria bacterium]|nr:PrgI family protein [Candidatus Magasanikbacteria bacterium]
MDQFVVPQFIDVEDKIIGPVTTRQFVILLTASLVIFVAYKLADTALFIFLLCLIGGSALILAFVKINGQPFHYFLLNIFQTLRRPSLRIWDRRYTDAELKSIQELHKLPVMAKKQIAPQISRSRIRQLSLAVNTGGYYGPEEKNI